jgi:hypothetical protein
MSKYILACSLFSHSHKADSSPGGSNRPPKSQSQSSQREFPKMRHKSILKRDK